MKDRVIVGAFGRRVRHLRLGEGPRPRDRQGGLDGAQHRARRRGAGPARHLQAVLRQGRRAGEAELARQTRTRPAARRSGAGCPTTPSSTWSTMGWAIPSPYNAEQRPGDNKWTGSVLARHPGDGALVWAYQFTPHDNWDYDAVSTMILADVKIGGRMRKALVTFNKNGFQYTLDRATGEVLAAHALRAGDLGQGHRPQDRTPDARFDQADRRLEGQREGRLSQPRGRREPGVARRRTHRGRGCSTPRPTTCAWTSRRRPAQHVRGTPYIGAGTPYHAGPGGHLGAFMAWDASTGQEGVGDQGALSRLERRAGHGGRCRVLRHARRLVQGGGREDRQAALQVQGRLRRRRQSDHLPRPRRQAVRRGLRRHRR